MYVDDIQIMSNKCMIIAALRKRKEDLGITYRELAERMNVAEKYVSSTLSPKNLKEGSGMKMEYFLMFLTALDLKMTIEPRSDSDVKSTRCSDSKSEKMYVGS